MLAHIHCYQISHLHSITILKIALVWCIAFRLSEAKVIEDLQISPQLYNDFVDAAKYEKISSCISYKGEEKMNAYELETSCLDNIESRVQICEHMEFIKILDHDDDNIDDTGEGAVEVEAQENLKVESSNRAETLEQKFTNKGYIALDKRAKRILLVFSGSKTWTDWATDLTIIQVPYEPYNVNSEKSKVYEKFCGSYSDQCKVHKGFIKSSKSLYRIYHKEILKLLHKYPEYEFWIVGHSLGGAIATLTGLEFKLLGYNPVLITAGSPKIGNRDIARLLDYFFKVKETYNTILNSEREHCDKLKKNHGCYFRLRHKRDLVPLLPMGIGRTGYSHGGIGFCITKSDLPHEIDSVKVVEKYFCDDNEDEFNFDKELDDEEEDVKEEDKEIEDEKNDDKTFEDGDGNTDLDVYQDVEIPNLNFSSFWNPHTSISPTIRRRAHAQYFLVVTNCRDE